MSRVRQVPQVPLSHELGTSRPWSRSASRMVLPTGTAIVSPLRASRTVNGLSSGFASAASVNASKCTADGDQWPVMSRTACIRPRGPQQ